MQQPPPPPPPPLPGALTGPPPPMPPQLQDMMRQMQQRQPKFQQARQQGGRGGRNGRGRGGGRGRGRGGFQQNNRQNRGYHNHQSQFKRKRGPSDDVPDASRFFMPSFLEDPWKQLEKNGQGNVGHEHEEKQQHSERRRGEMRPQQVHYPKKDGTGRVFFQPSFLEDPWAQLVH
ncbi:hypothetical protein P3T76_005181 [Phytophthora citrophthora]|uniref:Uncharacterized protein n=1 Tax=Phytophthora citrophthora TaxID=4793 RepID=A0AAD9GSI5_9STRA|nr:hypothetical protein P3T76_005181 [Phytophthora citrophthora]